MAHDFTAIIEKDEDWYIAYCPEVPGANGHGRTIEDVKANLGEAITLMLDIRREEGLKGLPADAMRDVVHVGRSEATF